MLNNVNVSGLSEMVQEVLEAPVEGVAKYGIALNWVSGTRMEVKTLPMQLGENKLVRDFSFEIDEPAQIGGINKSPNPQEYLLGGIASCIAVTFMTGATVNSIAIDSLQVVMKGELNLATFLGVEENNNAGFQELEMEITVKGSGSNEDYNMLLDRVKKHSPNFSNMVNEVKIVPSLVVLS